MYIVFTAALKHSLNFIEKLFPALLMRSSHKMATSISVLMDMTINDQVKVGIKINKLLLLFTNISPQKLCVTVTSLLIPG